MGMETNTLRDRCYWCGLHVYPSEGSWKSRTVGGNMVLVHSVDCSGEFMAEQKRNQNQPRTNEDRP
jgi:hypothetical protein